MSEPDWKVALRAELEGIASDIERGSGIQGGVDYSRRSLEHTVFEAVEAAYQRGLMAGRSQQGYSTRRKKKEDPCTTDAAGAAGSIPASRTGAGDEPPAGAAP